MSERKLPDIAGRREFVRLAGTASLVGAGLAACGSPASGDRQLVFESLDEAMREAARLAAVPDLAVTSEWSLAQTLVHCAQSIEYSVSGFPEPRSTLFQRTVGSAAFHVFDLRGRMNHDLAEPIPGAPVLDSSQSVESALTRLSEAVDSFHRAGDKLQPHFAFGEMSAPQYDRAHAMHLANHFSFMPA